MLAAPSDSWAARIRHGRIVRGVSLRPVIMISVDPINEFVLAD